jgi:hypothetical protein
MFTFSRTYTRIRRMDQFLVLLGVQLLLGWEICAWTW